MTPARRPGAARRPTSGRASEAGKPRAGRPAPRARAVPALAPPPLEPRRARAMLAGLAVFGVGFALAGVLVALRLGGTPVYWVLVSLGLLGIAAVGFSSPRGIAEAGRPAVWSRAGIAGLAAPLELPARAVAAIFYALLAVGVVGNLVVPVVTGRR